MYVIGIDPGGSGALYALQADGAGGWKPLDVLLMPFMDVGLTKPELDLVAVRDWIRGLEAREAHRCVMFVLERVGYMPGGSGFTDSVLTERTAEIWGMLKTMDLPRERVRPTDWQKVVLGGKLPSSRPNKSTAGQKEKDPDKAKTKAARAAKDARRKQIKAAVMDFCIRRYGSGAVSAPGTAVARHEGVADALAIAHYATTRL